MEISTYEQQAQDFLTQTEATIKIEFSHNGRHFDSDTDNRDIYNITLSRGTRNYTFKFGQSIAKSGFYYTKGAQSIDIDREFLNKENLIGKSLAGIIKKHDRDFLNNGKSDKIHYPTEPTAYDVLACLTSYDPESFEDFCSVYGYDTDSRSAEKTYKSVVDEYKSLCALFTYKEMEALQEIQ